MPKLNIMITGVAGFVGSNLAFNLIRKKKYNVIGVDNLEYGIREQIPAEVEFIQEDIREKRLAQLFSDIDVVFHFAAKNCIPDCQRDPVETMDINVTGTANIFECCAKNKVPKLIHAESSAIYEGAQEFPSKEDDANQESFYSMSKWFGHLLAEQYMKQFDLQIIGLRYFNVYGPRQDYRRSIPPLMSAHIINLLKGEPPIIYGDGSKRRDYVYVDDVNRFHEMLMDREFTSSGVYNIGSGINYSVMEIYDLIEEEIGSGLAPLHKANLPGEAFQNLADITKARETGWVPSVDIKEGIKRQISYIRKELKLP